MTSAYLIVMLMCGGYVHSQHMPLLDAGKTWSVYRDLSAEGQPGYSFFIRAENDTVINATGYRKVEYATDSLMTAWTLFAYMREDTLNRCVFLANLMLEEGMIYDFRLGLNDTGTLYNPCYSQLQQALPFMVISLDSVIAGGSYRKRWVLELQNMLYDTIVEGIGSLNGLTTTGNTLTGGGTYRLLCYSDHDSLIYQNANFSSCYVPAASGIFTQEDDQIRIFPNPVAEMLHLVAENHQGHEISFSISDPGGRILREEKFYGSLSLDLSALLPGLYFVRVLHNGRLLSRRLIKI